MAEQSLNFDGSTSFLLVPHNVSPSLDFGPNDFTVEWWQYETDTHSHTRPFQIGSYNNRDIQFGVSFEGSFILWTTFGLGNQANFLFNLQDSDYKNKWVHFAICRSSSQIQVFMNGVPKLVTPLADGTNYVFTKDLAIGSETDHLDTTAFFGGQMYAFTWIVGEAKYSLLDTFTPSVDPPTVDNNTRLMLVGSGVQPEFTPGTTYGSLGPSISNTNVTVNTNVTANANIPPPPPSPTQPYLTNKYNLLSPVDPIQRRKWNALHTVQQNYIDNQIYNKNRYAGTNDGYNTAQSLTRVRNAGATVPQKTQHSPFFAVRLFTPTGYVLGGGYRSSP